MVICISLLYLSYISATFYHIVKSKSDQKAGCVGNHLKLIYQSLAYKKHSPFYIQMIEAGEKAQKNLILKTVTW